jgi:CTP synthase
MSGVGKGIATASIAKIIQSRGIETTAVKIDPYVNVDAGTMNPTEHGEVFVLDDGMECDQDMGNYERFLGKNLTRANYMTTGSVYLSVIERERNLGYEGRQVEVVPRVPLEVIDRINKAAQKNKARVVITEIGGTVGEYENILFLEAVRMLTLKHPGDVVLALVSFVPALGAGGTELKTKPTQHAVRSLNAVGLHPDFIFGRAHVPLDERRKEKIAFMCSVKKENVISAPNVESIYDIPLNFEKEKLGDRILSALGIKSRRRDLRDWGDRARAAVSNKKEVVIGIFGKYFGSGDFVLTDSYISVIEAVKHAAYALARKPVIEWLDAEEFEKDPKKLKNLARCQGIIVPGGFGSRGVEGKIQAIRFVREQGIPFLGLCYGMQLAVVEFARNVAGMLGAHTTEVDRNTLFPVIDVLPEQKFNMQEKHYGGSMRLGGYRCALKKGTQAHACYQTPHVTERHRHRYEVNNELFSELEAKGLVASGINPDRTLVEIIELPSHPFFVATQFHPEFQSRFLEPHPLFMGFVQAARELRK